MDKYKYDETIGLRYELKQEQGITEQLKAENTMEWVGRMNNIWGCAREIVNQVFEHKIYFVNASVF